MTPGLSFARAFQLPTFIRKSNILPNLPQETKESKPLNSQQILYSDVWVNTKYSFYKQIWTHGVPILFVKTMCEPNVETKLLAHKKCRATLKVEYGIGMSKMGLRVGGMSKGREHRGRAKAKGQGVLERRIWVTPGLSFARAF